MPNRPIQNHTLDNIISRSTRPARNIVFSGTSYGRTAYLDNYVPEEWRTTKQADFTTATGYRQFLSSKFKHHHICECKAIFRCGIESCASTIQLECRKCFKKRSSLAHPELWLTQWDEEPSNTSVHTNEYVVDFESNLTISNVDFEQMEQRLTQHNLAQHIRELEEAARLWTPDRQDITHE